MKNTVIRLFCVVALFAARSGVFADIPITPNNLQATPLSSSAIKLTWKYDAGTPTGSITVEMRVGENSTFNYLKRVSLSPSECVCSSLQPNTEYGFQVYLENSDGRSGYSDPAYATTFPLPPLAPQNLTAAPVCDHSILLTWGEPSGGNAHAPESYNIFRDGSQYGWIAAADARIPGCQTGNCLLFKDTAVDRDTAHTYKVRAHNFSGDSPESNPAMVTAFGPTSEAPKISLPLVVKTGCQIDITGTFIACRADTIELEAYSGHSGTFSGAGEAHIQPISPTDMPPERTFTFSYTPTTRNTEYHFRARLKVLTGLAAAPFSYSQYSNEASVMTPPEMSPPDPFTASALDSARIRVSWVYAGSDAASFVLIRSTAHSGDVGAVTYNISGADRSFDSEGLVPNTTYYFLIRVKDACSNQSGVAETNARTPRFVTAPNNVRISIVSKFTAHYAKVSWDSTEADVTNFIVERSEVVPDRFKKIAAVERDIREYTDPIQANLTYHYRVRALASGDPSAWSPVVHEKVLNPSNAPSDLDVSFVPDGLAFSWVDGSNNERGFEIQGRDKPGAEFAKVGLVAPNVHVFTWKDSKGPGTVKQKPYKFYRVKAVFQSGEAYSNTASPHK